MQTQVKAPASTSFTPTYGGLLQRKCACGGTPGLDGQCAQCRRKRVSAQTSPLIQTKLRISWPGDIYEREADRVAEQVMRMPDREVSGLSRGATKIQRKCSSCTSGQGLCPKCAEVEGEIQRKLLTSNITPLIQRQFEEPEEDEEPIQTKPLITPLVQRQSEELEEEEEEILQPKQIPSQITPLIQRQPKIEEEEEEEPLQAKASASGIPEVTPDVESSIHDLGSRGQPLAHPLRAFFEPRFGQDFSSVRVHTDARAADNARAVNARAFTLGGDVVFGKDQYSPETDKGRRLLAHELTHVVQQGGCEKLGSRDATAAGHFGGPSLERLGQRPAEASPDGAWQSLTAARTPMIQRHPAVVGRLEATVKVRWTNDEGKFYQRVEKAIARSRRFRGVRRAITAFYAPVINFHRRLFRELGSLKLKRGTVLRLRVTGFLGPKQARPSQRTIDKPSVELEQAARLRETTVTGVLSTPQYLLSRQNPTGFVAGELVDLSFNAIPPATAASLGGLQWILASGTGSLAGGTDGRGTFSASATPGRVQLQLRVVSGFFAGRSVSTHDINIHAPSCKVKSGPTYLPSGTLTPRLKPDGVTRFVEFWMEAVFEDDPSLGLVASCCEVRQYIMWTHPFDRPRHFSPASKFPPNKYVEDHDRAGIPYGHRSGPLAPKPRSFDDYYDAGGNSQTDTGEEYKGRDEPTDSIHRTGEYHFELRIIDTCHGDRRAGPTSKVIVDWSG